MYTENNNIVLCNISLTVRYIVVHRYLVCVSESMAEVAPFGDVPDKLSAPLKRSFVASRTYVQALKIAGDILANINKVRITYTIFTHLFIIHVVFDIMYTRVLNSDDPFSCCLCVVVTYL